MILIRFYDDALAHASYLVGCPASGEAIIVDPNRNLAQYFEAAAKNNVRITAVTETHIHADFVSGLRELARSPGVTAYVSGEGGPDWLYAFTGEAAIKVVKDGDSFRVGGARFDVIHTPGHTPEHLTFLLTDEPASSVPLGLFTGDFVFVGDVGRPDLLETAGGIAGSTEPAARSLYQSIQKIRKLPQHLLVWPAHGAGSPCGKSLGGVPVSSLGYEVQTNWAFAATTEDGFVREVLSGQPSTPRYFGHMKVTNRAGADTRPSGPLTMSHQPVPTDTTILDVRPSDQYLDAHAEGSLHIPFSESLLRWAGWLLDYDHPIILVAPSIDVARETRDMLTLIGFDNVSGWMHSIDGGPLRVTPSLSADEYAVLPSSTVVLDVRNDDEWRDGHLARATHAGLRTLFVNPPNLDRSQPVAVHCQSGFRAPIAASVLERLGFESVESIRPGYPDLAKLDQSDQIRR